MLFPLQSSTGKVPRPRGATEAQIQQSIVQWLEWVAPDLTVFAVPNASKRTKTGRASNAVAGLRKGVFDLAVIFPPTIWQGVTAYVEIKTSQGKLSKDQQDFQDILISNRVPHCIARSIDDVREAFEIWGVPTLEASLPRAGAWPS